MAKIPYEPGTSYLVGCNFRPPAQGILNAIPTGTPLLLQREPENPYDPNAVKVLIDMTLPSIQSRAAEITTSIEGFGFTWDEVKDQTMHLGYVNKEQALILALDWAARNAVRAHATLNFDLYNRPIVTSIEPVEGSREG